MAGLGNLGLGLPLIQDISNLQLFNARPIDLIPRIIEPRRGVLGQLLICVFYGFFRIVNQEQKDRKVDGGSTFLDIKVPNRTRDLNLGICNAFKLRQRNFDAL